MDPKTLTAIEAFQLEITSVLDKANYPANPDKRRRKAAEIAALIYHSKILAYQEAIHVHDACCGGGILGLTVQYLRRERTTSVTGWDHDPECRMRFERTVSRLDLDKETCEAVFRLGDIAVAELWKVPDKQTFCLAKHACGDLTRSVLANIGDTATYSDFVPEKTVIQTCCHGKIQGSTPTPLLSEKEWKLLVKTSEWMSHSSITAREIGRKAMRLVDSLEAALLVSSAPNLRARVIELLPSDVSAKNHGIIIEPK